MLSSFSLIILLGLIFSWIAQKLKLPGLLGMLILGMLIGPYGLNILSDQILLISPDLRKIALIIILLRAGLGLSKDTLKKIGLPAAKLSCIPCVLEGIAIILVSMSLLGLPLIEAGMLGFIIAAVSPAVIVPQMLEFIKRGLGKEKGIPSLILAGASIDDVFAITLFTTFTSLYVGADVNLFRQLLNIPLSIGLGILLGSILGFIIVLLFKKFYLSDTHKVLIILGSAILFHSLEGTVAEFIPIASLLGMMVIGFILLEKSPSIATKVENQLNNIWIFAQLFLFVLVGAEVNIHVAIDSGFIGLMIILIGLISRSIGVLISVAGTGFSWKEKLFCMISFTPKATVQAAIGAVPLAMGVPSGEVILAISILSILITATLGAIGIKITGEKWL